MLELEKRENPDAFADDFRRDNLAENFPCALASAPFDAMVASAIKKAVPTANVDVTVWPVQSKSLADLEQDAKSRVRSFKPDLVVIAVPRSAEAESDEQFVHSYSWIMNWSLSFGHQEWDCVVVHPSALDPDLSAPRDELVRRLVKAQHLELVDRPPNDNSDIVSIFSEWIGKKIADSASK